MTEEDPNTKSMSIEGVLSDEEKERLDGLREGEDEKDSDSDESTDTE